MKEIRSETNDDDDGESDGNWPCFTFVCQQGELERKAVILAASLRHHAGDRHEIVAAVPEPAEIWGAPSPEVLGILRDLSVRIRPIANPVSPSYPIGNKLACLAVETQRNRVVFIDTDILVLGDFDPARLARHPICAVAASDVVLAPDQWNALYDHCGARPPADTMRTLVSGVVTSPYFNSGLVSVDSAIATELASEWTSCANRILTRMDLPSNIRHRFLDQVALPIAAARLGYPIAELSPEFNFPSWSWTLEGRDLPVFYHYQHLARLLRSEVTEAAFLSILETDERILRLFC